MKNSAADMLLHPYQGLHWQMSTCEKAALECVLRELSPEVAVEVGTYQGGSLQVLSRFAGRVDAIDLKHGIIESLGPLLPNVFFHTGDSKVLLPQVLQDNLRAQRSVEFVLIDGDHSAVGVRLDIEALLSVVPDCRRVVFMHDSFNPACREGVRTASWADSPYVHAVELDFVPGIYHENAYDTAAARTMWGGFACAVLQPYPRKGALQISASQQGLFDAVYRVSSHSAPSSGLRSRLTGVVRRLRAIR